jgi:hypothetical protein
MKGGAKTVVEQHRHAGIFIARGKEDALVTRNMAPGESVYGEKRVSVEQEAGEKIEYRVWNPFRSKLAAAVLAGVDNIHIKPGAKVLYLGAASGTSVSHVSDVVGPEGSVYAVEFSHRRWVAGAWGGGWYADCLLGNGTWGRQLPCCCCWRRGCGPVIYVAEGMAEAQKQRQQRDLAPPQSRLCWLPASNLGTLLSVVSPPALFYLPLPHPAAAAVTWSTWPRSGPT